MLLVYIYSGYLVLMSLITLFLFIIDKGKAKNNSGAARIKEKTLLGCVAMGGAVGGFIGRIIARHKTNKIYFSITIYFSLLLQIAVLLCILFVKVG